MMVSIRPLLLNHGGKSMQAIFQSRSEKPITNQKYSICALQLASRLTVTQVLLLALSINQTNGRGLELSRSWNRLYGHFLFEKGDFAMSLRAWHQVEEDEKAFPYDLTVMITLIFTITWVILNLTLSTNGEI